MAKHLPAFGWTPTVLTVRLDAIEGPLDPTLAHVVPADLDIIRTAAIPLRPLRLVGDIGIRSLPSHAWALLRRCRRGQIDAVVLFGPPWFSFALGPLVRKRCGTPYIVDYIDPWISDWSAAQPFPSKAWVYMQAARALEPIVLRSAAHITAVSEGILSDLRARYSWLDAGKLSAMPYGAEPDDFEMAERLGIEPPDFIPGDGMLNICFTGALQPRGREMLRTVFGAVCRLRTTQPSLGRRIRLRFYGTSNLTWGQGRYGVLPAAKEMGLDGVVSEIPERVPYLQSLAILRASDAVLVMGSWEHYYHASKLYPALLCRKPVLALCHEQSSIASVIAETGVGVCVSFSSPEDIESKVPDTAAALTRLLSNGAPDGARQSTSVERFSARAATAVLAAALDRAVTVAPAEPAPPRERHLAV